MKIAVLRLLRLSPAAVLLAVATGAEPDSPLQAVELSAREWVKVRAETTRLSTEWRNEHALLESTVNSLKERATMLEEKRDQLKARTAEERAELDSLHARQRQEVELLRQADASLQKLAERLLQLRPALPPRLSEALELPYRSLGSADPGERMQYALTVLNRCAQFNRAVSCGEEVVTVDGAAKSLEVIYWGLSHSYALDRSAGKTWLGSPRGGRWQWEPLDGAVREVTRLIDMNHDKVDPSFVMVPARLANSSR